MYRAVAGYRYDALEDCMLPDPEVLAAVGRLPPQVYLTLARLRLLPRLPIHEKR